MLKRAIGVLMVLAALPVYAEPVDKGRLIVATQTSSDAWLQLQREGGAASRHLQQATPAERELVLQRWLDSFKHPIPAFFEDDAGGAIQP